MESTKLAELVTANFGLQRSLLQVQAAQTDCNLAAMEAQIAIETSHLALIRYRQAQNQLAQAIQRSHSVSSPVD